MRGWSQSMQYLNWKTLKNLWVPIVIIVVGLALIFGPIGPYKKYPELNQLTLIQGELESIDKGGPELSVKLKNHDMYFFFPAKLKSDAHLKLQSKGIERQQIKLSITDKNHESVNAKGSKYYKIFELVIDSDVAISYQEIKSINDKLDMNVMYLAFFLILAALYVGYKKLTDLDDINT
jgi:hypothetical protein